MHQPGAIKKLLAVAMFLALAAWVATNDLWDEEIAFEGWEDSAPTVDEVAADVRPTPAEAKTMTRLGTQPDPLPQSGPYRFLSTQEGNEAPVTYDPCRPIGVVVNPRTRPGAAAGLVEDALETIGKATGLQFVVEGDTDEAPSDDRPDFQPDRYGDRWTPVLIAWSDEAESPRLSSAGGYAGSSYVEAEGRSVYVSGQIVLNGPDVAKYLDVKTEEFDGRVAAMDLLLHELGHLVGLGHVDDVEQVMFPEGRDAGHRGLGYGDLAGLREAGGGRCVETL